MGLTMDGLKKLLVMVKPKAVEAAPEMASTGEHEAPEAPEGLVCPKCGAVLADTPENQAYVAAQGADEDESGEDA